MEQTLKITLTADNKSALAGLRQTAVGLQDVTVASTKTNAALSATSSAVKSNTTTWMNLSRVVQDAPYGFNGIANNLTQLIPGVGALGFAFSALVTAITFASIGFGAWTGHAKDATKASDEFNDSLKSERETADKSISSMKALVSTAQNHSISLNDRKIAIDKLQSEYPAYFKNLSDEQILTGDITKATDLLTAAIYKRAEARAKEADIAKKAGQVFENQQKIDQLNKDIEKAKADKLKGSVSVGGGTLGGVSGTSDAGFNRTLAKEIDLIKQKDKLLAETSTLQSQIALTQLNVNAITAETIGLDQKDNKGKKEKLTDLQKILQTLNKELANNAALLSLGELTKSAFDVENAKAYTTAIKAIAGNFHGVDGILSDMIQKRDSFFGKSVSPLERGQTVGTKLGGELNDRGAPESISTDQTAVGRVIELSKVTSELEQQQKLYNSALKTTETIMGVLGPEVDGLFDALLKGQSIGDALGKVFTDLASQIAKAAIKAAIFQAILSAIPGGSIGGAAVGSAKNGGGFFGAFKKLLGFAGGGVASGPKSGYPVMLHGTEAIFNGGQLKNLVNNVSASTRMGMSNMNSNSTSKELGQLRAAVAQLASQPVQIMPFMKGADMNILINRTQQQTSRNY